MTATFGAVALLDVLGAQSFTVERAEAFLEQRDKFLVCLAKKLADIADATCDRYQLVPPEILTFGDTIMLLWKLPEDDAGRFMPFLAEWLRPSIMAGLCTGLLLRGAVSVGHFVRRETTVVGPAVADAASWYEAADWLGIIATPSCGHRLLRVAEQLRQHGRNLNPWFVIYDVPLKSGGHMKLWSVSWPAQYSPSMQVREDMTVSGLEFLMYHLQEYPVPPGTETKYANTIAYFRWFHESICLTVHSEDAG